MTDATPIPDDFKVVTAIARQMKEDLVAEFGDNRDSELSDLHGFIVIVRAGDPVGIVHIGAGPSATPDTCYATTMIMRPDELYLVSDAYMRTFPPEKGIPNVPRGQFQDDWQAGIREGTTECIIVQRMAADGESTMASYPYERSSTQLRWLKEPTDLRTSPGGAITTAVKQGYANAHETWPKLEQALSMADEATGLSEAQREYHMDRACARYLTSETDAVVHLFNGEATFVNGEEQK